jgi:acyl-CoA synthetase (AMP-forming)/AMP-acid ligase II
LRPRPTGNRGSFSAIPDSLLERGRRARARRCHTSRRRCFVSIIDRVETSFEVAGRVVYPGDVERAIAEHPAVTDHVAAHGDRSRAFVVPAPGAAIEDPLLQTLPNTAPFHEVPASVVVLDRLRRSSVGKLLRHELESLGGS